jgi:hypothetical protein
LTGWKVVLAVVGVIGLLVVPGFVWVVGLGLDGASWTGVLVIYGLTLAISLGGSLALLIPAMEASPGWRIGVALVLLAYVVPLCIRAVWPLGSVLVAVAVGGVPAVLGLAFLASGREKA